MWTCTFTSAVVPDDEERVAERLQALSQTVGVEPFTLDEKDGAVAVARSLVVDRLLAQLVELDRDLGQRLYR